MVRNIEALGRRNKIYGLTIPKEESCKTRAVAVFEKSMAENFLNLTESIELQFLEGQPSSPKHNWWKVQMRERENTN